MAKITSNALTFIDQTDSRKFEVHISSNLPQVQIYDQNNKTYSPDWSNTALNLQASIYLDSTDITANTNVTIEWYKNSISTATKIGNGKNLTINTNVLSTEPIITYICQAKYQNLTTNTRIDYTRVDSGINGSSGTSAPAVQAQYSVDGTAWTTTLNAATHKYVKYSYDGGKTWTTAIKMVGEDGKSVAIKGTATSVTAVSGTNYYTVTYGGTSIATAALGDSYLYGGDLYVCSELRDGADYFINVGKIQGAKGNDGESSYVYIRYATSSSGANMTASPSSQTTYIGIHVSSSTTAPTTASSYTWSKFVGDSAKSIILSGDSQVFKVSKSSAYTPTTIKVTAQTINTSVTSWSYNTNDGKGFVSTAPTGVTRNDNIVTITGSTLATDSIVIKASNGSIEDVFTVYKAFDGTNGNPGTPGTPASMAFLTNENITFGANASGQILATSFSTNVVAYSGTTKTTPTIGTISGLPTGMTVKIGTAVNNEVPIVFTIENNATLGSVLSNNGSITIPVNVPVYTNLILSWSKVNSGAKGDKGNQGVSIKSTTVAYGVSDSASTLPIDTAWQSTIPTAEEGEYLWTRTIIDYTDDAIADTVTYTYAKQGTKGDTGSSGSSVTVSSIQYQEGVSATTTPTGTWSNSVVSVAEGKYLWTKTVFSDGKIAYGVAKQGVSGKDGVGINSTTVSYGSSDSSTVKPTVWYPDIPAVEEGKYLWTRTVTDYTDSSKADTVTYVYAKQGIKGDTGSSGTSVTVKSIKYQSGTSATTAPTGTWSDSVVAVAEGNYLWTQTTFSDNKVAYGVAKQGQKGDTGRGISKITEYYLATTAASGVTTATTGWTPAVQTIDTTKKYLWNYELITYTDNATNTTTPVIIGVFGNTGNTGKGIKSITEYYLASTASSGVTTSTSGWKDTMQTLTSTNKYLWNYELITYTDNSTATINPVIIGVYGDQGIQGIQGPKGNDAYTVMLTNESHIFAGDVSNAIAGSATTQVLAYNGSTAQTVTIVSVNSKTAATADTDTGIAGLKFKCSALSGASPTITFTCTTSFVSKSGAIPIVLSVGGVSFTKMFTYSIAFKGTTGNPGNPGSPGTPASLVDITPSALYFKSTTGKDGAFTPDYIYLYPRFQTVTYSKWEYSTNGGTSWTTVTSGSNGLTIGTYNSIAYSLQIAKNSALYTDTVTSISFRCVSSNSAVYDTVSIAKIYDVVDLQIGGRNLILASNVQYSNSEYRVASYNMSEDWELNATYTLTLKGTIEEGKIFGAWANGSGTRVATLTYDAVKGVYTSTFVTPATIASQTPKVINIYNTPSTTPGSASIEWIKLEKGNKATDWSPAPEDLKSTTFQLYAPKGYLITNDAPTITLETFAYDGSQVITNATFVWYSWNGESWVVISGATGASLTINRSNVFKSNVYKCDMTYGGKVYTATATVEDKTDIYDSLIHITSKYSPSNRLYWVLYSTVYSEEGEKDELLGPVSVIAPTSPATGAYWYKIDETNYTVTLMKYSGTAWVATTDKQEFVYDWFMLNDTNSIVTLGERSKVKIVTSDNFSRTCSIQCNVLDQELAALTHSNQVINDPSDPIVSETEPTNPVNGQLWIKTNANGSYMLLVWDASNSKWVVSEADTQKKVYVQKPTAYNEGDIWIVAAEYEPDAYVDGVLQKETIEGVTKVVKHIAGTMLMAQYASQTYKDSDWIDALKYTKALDKVNKQMDIYNQFFTFDNTGMTMKAKSLNGQISEFSTKLTNTELGFYQGENKVAYINNNQLNISKAEITNGMKIGGTEPMLQIGNFVIMQESNGSLSIGLKS